MYVFDGNVASATYDSLRGTGHCLSPVGGGGGGVGKFWAKHGEI